MGSEGVAHIYGTLPQTLCMAGLISQSIVYISDLDLEAHAFDLGRRILVIISITSVIVVQLFIKV